MENKINIAELLKDCPSSMELDCTMFENVTFVRVDMSRRQFPIEIAVGGTHSKYLTKEGCFHDTTLLPESKCVIFPKGKTTWEGFVPPCKFKEGDVAISERDDIHLLCTKDSSYCVYRESWGTSAIFDSTITTGVKVVRLATEEEKQKLFKAIKDNGYKWNAKTKTLEKLIEFNDGDILATDLGSVFFLNTRLNTDERYGCYVGKGGDGSFHICEPFAYKECCGLATKKEKQKLFDAIKANGYRWNAETKTLEKLVEPKFKVGNSIQSVRVNLGNIYNVIEVKESSYVVNKNNENSNFHIDFDIQDDWELVPNKFDTTTLKPFESRVLVRDYDNQIWIPTFWGKYLEDSNCRYLTTNGCYKYCIPDEGNHHLLGTTNDCDDYYKTWEE